MRVQLPLPLAVLSAALVAGTAVAQEGPRPRLVLSIGAGAHSAHDLWEVPFQPLEIPPNTNVYDSVRIARSIESGLLVALSATYFPGGRLGFYGDVTFLDMGMDNSCSPAVAFKAQPDPNEVMCTNFTSSVSANTALLFGVGVAVRADPGSAITPYLRAGAGYARLSHSTVAAEAPNAPATPPVQIIADPDAKAGSPSFLLAAGLTQSIGSGYQLRLEVRDDYFGMERVIGPANALGEAPTETRWYHHISLVIGFDIVFDRRHARRY